jgi:hypothetical protein
MHLQHPKMTFIGTGETIHVTGSGNNTEYVLSGEHPPPTAAGSSLPKPTAFLIIDHPKAFHGTIDLGPYSAVILEGLSGTAHTYDPTQDLLKIYQGTKVVDTLHLNWDSASGASFNVLGVQNDNGIFITDGYNGLSQHI